MHGAEILIPIICGVSFFAMCSYIVAVLVGGRSRNKLAQIRSELQTRMLDKFGTAGEFVEFAKTEEGRKLLENSTIERPILANRTLASISRGIVVTMFGIGFVILTLTDAIDRDFGIIISVLALCLGVGFLTSGFVARKLGQAWGINDGTLTASDSI